MLYDVLYYYVYAVKYLYIYSILFLFILFHFVFVFFHLFFCQRITHLSSCGSVGDVLVFTYVSIRENTTRNKTEKMFMVGVEKTQSL